MHARPFGRRITNRLIVGVLLLHSVAAGCGGMVEGRRNAEAVAVPENALIVSPGEDTIAAAKELQVNLKEVCGVEIPVSNTHEPGRFAFVLERKPVAAEGWSWSVTASNVVFGGKVEWAVCDFLERSLGVRWPAGDMIVAPPQNPIRMAQTSASGQIGINIRTVRSAQRKDEKTERAGRSNSAFKRRMRDGRHDAPKYGHAFTDYWRRYGKDHPEYIAMRKDGIRAPKGVKDVSQLGNIAVYAANVGLFAVCVTCDGLVGQIVRNWEADGKPEYINLCENDVPGQDSCQCPACKKLDVLPEKVDSKWETHYADRYVYFGNRVLSEARKLRHDVKVCYYAYNATQDAPKREHPSEGSVIGIVPTIFTHEYIADYIGSWSKAGAKCYFYRPNRHHYFAVQYLPVGSERHFFELFKYIRGAGCIGFDYDAPAKVGFFQWMQDYVLYRAMAYEDETFEEIENHYFDAFGPAKEDAKSYWRYWREQVWDVRLEPNLDDIVAKGKWFNFARGLLWNLKDYYGENDFSAVEPFLAAAEKRDLAPAQKRLVAEWRKAHEHAKVFYAAVARKSKANTEKLVAFRKANGFPLYHWNEQYFGDITGVRALLGPEKR